MDWPQALLLTAAGMVGGAMNSIAGGGTVLTFPALMYAGVPPLLANATCTVAMLSGTVSSFWAYKDRLPALRRWILIFGPASVFGGWLGALLLTHTPGAVFAKMVPYLLLFATLLFMAQGLVRKFLMKGHEVDVNSHGTKWLVGAAIFMFFIGIYGGYFGAGIGILMLACFGFLGFRDIHEMNTLKTVFGAVMNGVAAAAFIFTLPIAWKEAGFLALGTIIGGYGGAAIAQKVPQKVVRWAVVAIGLGISLSLFINKK